MIGALFKALGQFPDKPFRRAILRALGYSMVLFAALVWLIWWFIESTRVFGLGWLEWMADALGVGTAIIVAVMLFPGAVLAILAFLLEDIARAVEARHYPELGPPRAQPALKAIANGLKLSAVVIFWNLIALPAYVLLWWLPPLNLFVFYGLNGYLLGKEYFELVAHRRLDATNVRSMWRANLGVLWIGGVIITLALSIPLVNWLMPVLAAAFMLHLFEKIRRAQAA